MKKYFIVLVQSITFTNNVILNEWINWINSIENTFNIIYIINTQEQINNKLFNTQEQINNKLFNLSNIKYEIINDLVENKKESYFNFFIFVQKYIENIKIDVNVNDIFIFMINDECKYNNKTNIELNDILTNYITKFCYFSLLFNKINNDTLIFEPSISTYSFWIEHFANVIFANNFIDFQDMQKKITNVFFQNHSNNFNNLVLINKNINNNILLETVNNSDTNNFFAYDHCQHNKIVKISDIKNVFNNQKLYVKLYDNIALSCLDINNYIYNKKYQQENTNILYLIEKNQYISKMSRVRFNAMRELGKLCNVTYWGNGWNMYDDTQSLDSNIKSLSICPDYIICYKPLVMNNFSDVKITKCISYNEMWDETYTLNEINSSKPNLIVCHHENDMVHYTKTLFKSINCFTKLVHIPHCADEKIFYNKNMEKSIDIMLCGTVGRHYPLRQRFRELIKNMPSKYNCIEYSHPGYIKSDAFTDVYLKDFANAINKAKICITCTSKYKYRLGKMVEIPMCGSVLACDVPNQDTEIFNNIMINISEKMSNEEIMNKLIFYLENPNELEQIRINGNIWSQKYVQKYYAKNILYNLKLVNRKPSFFVLADELKSIKNKWICDVLKEEFNTYSGLNIVDDPKNADIIWLMAPWSVRKINKQYLEQKFVVTTFHHIDWDKYDAEYYKKIDGFTNRYHSICPKSTENIKKVTKKEIITSNFWINENNYYKIYDKKNLRKKYNIPENAFVVGSFQKDTEGSDDMTPKLSKGPDIFINIIDDMKNDRKELFIILTGWRRNYVITELKKLNVNYSFFELVNIDEINELYNCLDLYLVSSRVEGGPRSIIECALAKVPIISTNVGIAELILHPTSIYDLQDFKTYKKAKINIEYAYKNAYNYTIKEYMNMFVKNVFYDI